MSRIKIDNQTEFVNFPNREIRGELESVVTGELQKYKSCEERRERLLEKIKIDKSQISRLLRTYVEAGKKFGMDDVFDALLGIFSPSRGGIMFDSFSYQGIRTNLVGGMDEEDIYDFVNLIIAVCSSAPDACVEKKSMNQKEDKATADIQRMKHLLDILDRHRKGELTSEDVAELKENSESWRNDIEKLAETIHSLNMDIVV